MQITKGIQKEIQDIKDQTFDLFIFACNNEARRLTLRNSLTEKNSIKKSIGVFYNEDDLEYIEGTLNIVIKDQNDIINLLDRELQVSNGENYKIFVDYSCMTKTWYYAIILYLKNRNLSQKMITAFFGYTPSTFSSPLAPRPNIEIGPVPGKINIPNTKPKALIVGLGYEENKAQGIIDQLDPAITYLFYTDPSLDKNFVEAIEKNNTIILNEFKDNTVKYPFNDLLFLERELTSLYFTLVDDYNFIIAPFGPKPFAFVAMVLSAIHNDIEIWRTSIGEDTNPYPRTPIEGNHFIISEIVFSKVNF